MINTVVSDFSKVILFPKDASHVGSLNGLYDELEASGDYVYLDHFMFNEEILDFYEKLGEEYSVNIFTTGAVQNHSDSLAKIQPIFEKIISARDIGMKKSDPAAFERVLEILDKKAEECIFIDDTLKNIEAAREAGLHTVHFKDNEQVKREVSNVLEQFYDSE